MADHVKQIVNGKEEQQPKRFGNFEESVQDQQGGRTDPEIYKNHNTAHKMHKED